MISDAFAFLFYLDCDGVWEVSKLRLLCCYFNERFLCLLWNRIQVVSPDTSSVPCWTSRTCARLRDRVNDPDSASFYCVCHLSVFRRSVSWLDVRIALLRVIDVQRVFMRRSGVDFNAGRLARSKILPFRCGSPAMCCVLAGRFRRNVSKMRTFLRQNQNTSYPSREVDNSAFVSDASRDVCRNRLGNDACMSLQNTVEWCGGVCIGSLLSESHLRDYQTCDTLGRCFSTFLMSRPTFAPISKSHKKWSYWSVESAPTRPYVCNTWSPHLPWVCGTHNCNPGLKMGAFLGWNATILHFWLS